MRSKKFQYRSYLCAIVLLYSVFFAAKSNQLVFNFFRKITLYLKTESHCSASMSSSTTTTTTLTECNKTNMKTAAACHYRQQQRQPQAPCNPGIQIKGSWQSKLGVIFLFLVLDIIGFLLAQTSRYYKPPTTYGKPPRHRLTRQKPVFGWQQRARSTKPPPNHHQTTTEPPTPNYHHHQHHSTSVSLRSFCFYLFAPHPPNAPVRVSLSRRAPETNRRQRMMMMMTRRIEDS